MRKTLTRVGLVTTTAAALVLGPVVGPTMTAQGGAPASVSVQAQEEADPVTQLAAKAMAASPLAPQAAQANNGLAPGTYYKWTYTCDFKRVGHNLWMEHRADVWFGHVNMGCKPTGYVKQSTSKPTSPWYNWRGTQVR